MFVKTLIIFNFLGIKFCHQHVGAYLRAANQIKVETFHPNVILNGEISS